MSRLSKGLLIGLLLAGGAAAAGLIVFDAVRHDGRWLAAAYAGARPRLAEIARRTGAARAGQFITDTVFRRIPVFFEEDQVWSAEELAVKAKLEEHWGSNAPTHLMVYDRDKSMLGRLVEEQPEQVLFEQRFGGNGRLQVKMPRSRVDSVEEFLTEPPEISRRDVRFALEFPAKQLFKNPPYTVVTDESFFAVEHIVQLQKTLHRHVRELFAPLVSRSAARSDVQMLIFSSPAEYDAYRSRHSAELQGTSGFYAAALDRMVLFHQRDADWVKDGKKQIAEVEQQYAGQLDTPEARERLNQWRMDAQSQLLSQADRLTKSVIRHESAHQLLATLGILHPRQKGRDWVSEGLATYLETPAPGWMNPIRIPELRAAVSEGRLIPLPRLMASERFNSSLAYSESWALVHLLMQAEYRKGFLAYLDWLRSSPGVASADPVEELCDFIRMDADQFEARWLKYVRDIAWSPL